MEKLKPKIVNPSALSMAERMALENEAMTYKPYHDTVGKLTIGVGRNLEDRGITWEEAKLLLAHDLVEAHNELWSQFSFFRDLSDARKAVMMDLYHNMGITRLLGFKKMLRALQIKDYDEAALQLRQSQYWKQVGSRAQRNYCMLMFDKFFTKEEAESYFMNQNDNE